ncbi:MAG: hypothetical protein JNM83_05475 [Myxococcales bacterium]|jgi:hypothetical protein|nr:hypothetical protein [Myxococcales bacterium]
MGTSKQSYSRQTLEETPERVLKFLAGVAASAEIRTLLAQHGYTDAEHQLGWKLLHAATGYQATGPTPVSDRAAAEAIAELDAWDEPNFRLARATLMRRFPDQGEFVFQDLTAATGPAALLSVKSFLDRLDMLEGKLPGRDHKQKERKTADQKAVATLAERGIAPEERARLRKLLATAQSGAKPIADGGKAEASAQAGGELVALEELRGFYDEWAEVARVVIRRRDYHIRLGLAKRKRKTDPDAGPSDPQSPAGG